MSPQTYAITTRTNTGFKPIFDLLYCGLALVGIDKDTLKSTDTAYSIKSEIFIIIQNYKPYFQYQQAIVCFETSELYVPNICSV